MMAQAEASKPSDGSQAGEPLHQRQPTAGGAASQAGRTDEEEGVVPAVNGVPKPLASKTGHRD